MLMRENPLELIKRLFRYFAKIVTTVRDSIVSLIIEKESINRNVVESKYLGSLKMIYFNALIDI